MGFRLLACWSSAVAIGLACAGVASASSGYVSPFPNPGYFIGRTDMGVDACLSPGDPIAAVGDSVIVGVQHDWFEKQPYIWYQLTDGPNAGQFVYVAEQIDHLAAVGQQVSAGQTIARYAKKGSCLETGWSAANGQTLAVATTGYTEGQVTPAGISFARFLIAHGVQGSFELKAPPAHTASHKHRTSTPKPAPKPSTPSPAKPATPPAPSGGSVAVPGVWWTPSGGSAPDSGSGTATSGQAASGGGSL